jgi:Ca2+-transporting ATPase
MNLVTDGLPALALGVEPAEERIMKRPPYSSTESVFGRGAVPFIIGMGIVMSVLALAVGIYSFRSGTPHWQTLLFTTLIFAQLALALGVRSEENSLFKIGLLSNRSMLGAILMTVLLQMAVVYIPVFQRIFRTAPLSWQELAVALGVSVAVWLVTEVVKVFLRRRRSS